MYALSSLFRMKQPLKGCLKIKCSQNPGNLFLKHLWGMINISYCKLERQRPTPVRKMNSFTDSLEEFCLSFKQRCIPFWNIQKNYFAERLSITACYLNAKGIYKRMCNVILHPCRDCRQTLWTDSPNASINDIPLKRITQH